MPCRVPDKPRQPPEGRQGPWAAWRQGHREAMSRGRREATRPAPTGGSKARRRSPSACDGAYPSPSFSWEAAKKEIESLDARYEEAQDVIRRLRRQVQDSDNALKARDAQLAASREEVPPEKPVPLGGLRGG